MIIYEYIKYTYFIIFVCLLFYLLNNLHNLYLKSKYTDINKNK